MYILKILLSLLFLICSLYAKELLPTATLKTHGGTTDIVTTKNNIYISTDMGKIDIFDKNSNQYNSSIQISQITDFAGDLIESKIYSVDVLDNKVLIVSQGEKGGRNVFIYDNSQLQTIISDKKRLFVTRAKFLNDHQIIYSTLSNQLILFDLIEKTELYNVQVSQSKFSYSVLNENKSAIIIADESGDLKVIDTKSGAIKTTLSNQNLDNVFQVDWKNSVILTAGQDRQSVLYSSKNLQPYIRKSGFLIYGCALNTTSSLAAYSSNEQNDVTIFDTESKKNLFVLKGNNMTITKILFIKKDEILVGSDDKKVNFYKLKD